jgi:uncharacterized protein YyaL (SSP411 family)
VYETLDFIENELTAPGGGFYSSLDADSEGKKKKYYVWTAEEINILGKEALFSDYYNSTKKEIRHKKIFYSEKILTHAEIQISLETRKTKLKKVETN